MAWASTIGFLWRFRLSQICVNAQYVNVEAQDFILTTFFLAQRFILDHTYETSVVRKHSKTLSLMYYTTGKHTHKPHENKANTQPQSKANT